MPAFNFGDVNDPNQIIVDNQGEEIVEEPKDNLNGSGDKDDLTNPDDGDDSNKHDDVKSDDDKGGKSDKEDEVVELEKGSTIKIGDDEYTVGENGDILDKDGKVHVEADKVKEWFDSFDKVDEITDKLNIDNIINIVGVEITDNEGNKVEFENTPQGIKSYIDSVIETKREEHFEMAMESLYQRYPIVEDFINYYVANGGDYRGFGQDIDYSAIEIKEDNVEQQKNIIRHAWSVTNRPGDVDGYIAYLESASQLYSVATSELENLVKADDEKKKQIAEEAARVQSEQDTQIKEYWQKTHDTIIDGKLGNYKIPDTIIVNKNGTKVSKTKEDFFNYLYRTDKDGKSQYVKDLEAETVESRLYDDLTRAYLKFTGGNYGNLIDMEINKQKVIKLRDRANSNRGGGRVVITRPTSKPKTGIDVDLGY